MDPRDRCPHCGIASIASLGSPDLTRRQFQRPFQRIIGIAAIRTTPRVSAADSTS